MTHGLAVGDTVPGMGNAMAVLSRVRGLAARGSAGVVDAVVATLLLAGSLAALAALSRDAEPVVGGVACAGMAAAVALRRRAALPSAAVAIAALVAYELATHDPNGAFSSLAVVLTFYTVGRTGAGRRRLLLASMVVGCALVACAVVSAGLHDSLASALSSWLGLVCVPIAVGTVLARRSALTLRLAQAATQLQAELGLSATRAAADERNRLARDLHDVVAHCVSVMVVQAGAARLVVAQSPGDADKALAVIGDCGREAMADLRRIVGVLHRDVDPDLGYGAGIADLDRLADRVRAAGVPTDVEKPGHLVLPPAVDVVVYRVVQEALTNVVKHGGTGSTAAVRMTIGATALTVEITSTVGDRTTPLSPRSGHGLVGMRERVTAYGGEVRTGPRSGGGYLVEARLPVARPNIARDDSAGPPNRHVVGLRRLIPERVSDAAVVTAWLVAMEVEAATSTSVRGPWMLNAAAVAVMALAAGWRRRHPLLLLGVVGALAAGLSSGLTSLDRSTVTGLYSLVVPLFAVAAWQTRRRAVAGLALWVAGAGTLALARHAAGGGLAGALAMGLVVWTAGRLWGAQRVLTKKLNETTTRLRAERDQRAQLAAESERTRIARELHGLVAQGVVAMVVQAAAARRLLNQPGAAEEAIRGIEHTGRDALSQLRRILGVLRATDGPPAQRTTPATEPLPVLDSDASPGLRAEAFR